MPPKDQQNKDLREQVADLQEEVKELLEWKKQRELQQISFPLDDASRQLLNNELD